MIYIIGDSFTSGEEIADHLLPFWEGYRTQSDTCEKNIEYFDKLNKEVIKNPELEKIEMDFKKENRWPTVLGKLLNKEIINKGHTGKSISNMATVMAQDMCELLQKNQKPELIIVQLTSLHRFQLPGISLSNYPNTIWYTGHADYVQINPNAPRHSFENYETNDHLEKIKISKYLLLDDDDFFYDYLNNLLTMQLLAKLMTGKDLLLVSSIFDFSNEIESTEKKPKDSFIHKVYDLLDFRKKYEMFPSMKDIVDQNPNNCFFTRGWHVCHNTHKIFAENIAIILTEKKILS